MNLAHLHLLLGLLLFPCSHLFSQKEWESFIIDFEREYRQLNIAPLRIAYVDNLTAIPSLADLESQEQFTDRTLAQLLRFQQADLLPQQQIAYKLLNYELRLLQERLELEQKWIQIAPDTISSAGLAHLPLGKEFYQLFLKRWLDNSANPDSLFQFGLKEIAKVQASMKRIQVKAGMDSLAFANYLQEDFFFYPDATTTQEALEDFARSVNEAVPIYFPETQAIPLLTIREGTDQRLAQVPGFYRNNSFFFNFFNTPFNKRQVGWLYLHEGIPGHHYEVNHRTHSIQSPLQRLFYFPVYSEGWAAYIEDLALDIGLYRDIYDEYGKWEWDLIRSVRVCLDVGINYYGWSDETCITFWRTYIQGQDHIAHREIARMKRWPCQVITYKYGAQRIHLWKRAWETRDDFSLMTFHTALLQYGPLPLSVLESIIFPDTYSLKK